MAFHLLSLMLAGILSLADYVTETIHIKKLRKNQKLISFSSGVVVSYIILSLFPEIASYALSDGKSVFLFALIGFVTLNLVEQYIYKEVGQLKSPSLYHKGVHVAYFFIYNFFIGVVLVSFASKGLVQTMLFFVPFLLYIIAEMLPQEFEFKNQSFKLIYSLAPLFGAVFGAMYISFVMPVLGELISLVTGTLLYIVIRESLPSDKAEKPLYFMSGVLCYTLIIFLSWSLG